MRKVELTHDAERDLIEIYLYGAEHFGYAQAERYAETLSKKMEFAAENPTFGSNYDFIRDGLRRFESVSHSIYYQPIPKGILVLRILHGRMDPARHFS